MAFQSSTSSHVTVLQAKVKAVTVR